MQNSHKSIMTSSDRLREEKARIGRMSREMTMSSAKKRYKSKPAPASKPAPIPAPASRNCSSSNVTDYNISRYSYDCDDVNYQRYLLELDPLTNTDCLIEAENKMIYLNSEKSKCDWEEKTVNESCYVAGKCVPSIPPALLYNYNNPIYNNAVLFQKILTINRKRRLNTHYSWMDDNCALQVLHDLDIINKSTAEKFHNLQGRNITSASGHSISGGMRGGLLDTTQLTYLLKAKYDISHPYDTLLPTLLPTIHDFISILSNQLMVGNMSPLGYIFSMLTNPGVTIGHAVMAYKNSTNIYIIDRAMQGGYGNNPQEINEYFKNLSTTVIFKEFVVFCIIEDRRIDISNRDDSPKRKVVKSPKRKVVKSPKRKVVKSPKRKVVKSPKRKVVKSPKRKVVKSPRRKVVKSPRRKVVKSPRRKVVKSPRRKS